MFKMTTVALGLCFIIIFVCDQAKSQSSTQSTATAPKNTTASNMTTGSTTNNSTKPGGAGSSVRCGATSLLLPFAAAVSVLRGRS